jgi:hypothetical protein
MKPAIDIIRVSRSRRAQDIIGILFSAVRFLLFPGSRPGQPALQSGYDGPAMEEFLKAVENYVDLTPIPDDVTSVLVKVE